MENVVLSYNEDQATRILAKMTAPTDFLQTPVSECKRRDWERERKRLVSYDLHALTLAEYYRLGRIPRGLRVNLRPTLFAEKAEFKEKFERILNKCSMDIMLLTIESLQEAMEELQPKVEVIEQQLTDSMNATDFAELKEKVETYLKNYRKEIELQKRNKFHRDAEDYRLKAVYKWQQPGSGYSRRPSGGYSSSSSANSQSSFSNRRPFFQRNRGRNRRGDRGGRAAIIGEQAGGSIQTRSQVRTNLWS